MGMEDSISRALRLIVADDRRKPDDEEATARLWRDAFRSVKGDDLLRAVGTWLEENPRGRPNVGKLKEILDRQRPPEDQKKKIVDDDRRRELVWAVSVLEDAGRYAQYQATLSYAERCLAAQGFRTWQDAKFYLEPGWVPHLTNEAYL